VATSAPAADAPPPHGSDLDPGVDRDELPEVPTGPLAVFAEVERAWTDGDVEALVELLDPEEKVRLEFAGGGPRGGWFNRDQAFFLLKDMFAYSSTERFEFRKYWNLDSQGRSPYAVAEREILTNGALNEDEVYISLRRRGESWYVGEIRSIDH
jgi:hypothetical protein